MIFKLKSIVLLSDKRWIFYVLMKEICWKIGFKVFCFSAFSKNWKREWSR